MTMTTIQENDVKASFLVLEIVMSFIENDWTLFLKLMAIVWEPCIFFWIRLWANHMQTNSFLRIYLVL